jgi:hypothetical protein
MATPKIEIAPELVAEGKRLYEETLTPVHDIAAMMGVSRRTLENRIREWNWRRRRHSSGAVDLFHAVRGAAAAAATAETLADGGRLKPGSPEQRAALALRIHNVVERQMAAVEDISKLIKANDLGEAERCSRTLASVARILREIVAIYQPEEQVTAPDESDDDAVPRDIDEFRRELARRIHALIEAERGGGSPGAESAAARLEARRI